MRDILFFGGYRNDKGDTLAASYYHSVSPLTNTAVGAELTHCFSSNENTLTIGTQHALDPLTTVKARVNNYGKASALIRTSGALNLSSLSRGKWIPGLLRKVPRLDWLWL